MGRLIYFRESFMSVNGYVCIKEDVRSKANNQLSFPGSGGCSGREL